MTPSFAVKAGIRYRYYVSRATIEGRKDAAGSIVRVPAADIERVVVQAISGLGKFEREAQAVKERIEKINIRPTTVSISLNPQAAEIAGRDAIVVDWVKPPFRVNREILPPANGERDDPGAMSFDTRGRLLNAIGKARVWAKDLVSGREADIETIARKEGRSARSVSMLLSLAFLAPGLVKAIAENRMPRGIGLTRMTDLPSEWPMQWRALGLAENTSDRVPG
jgi:site-specific DNA recombinase